MKKRFPQGETVSTLVPMRKETTKIALGRNHSVSIDPVCRRRRALPPSRAPPPFPPPLGVAPTAPGSFPPSRAPLPSRIRSGRRAWGAAGASSSSGQRAQTTVPRVHKLRPRPLAPVLPLSHDGPRRPSSPTASRGRRVLAVELGLPLGSRPPARGPPPTQPRRPASSGRSPSLQVRRRRDGAGRQGTRPTGGAMGRPRQRRSGDE
jgi:hypothetical protein